MMMKMMMEVNAQEGLMDMQKEQVRTPLYILRLKEVIEVGQPVVR